jgi:hypothetical protein
VYYLDKSGSTVVSLSNLYPDRNCSAGKKAGKIVKRDEMPMPNLSETRLPDLVGVGGDSKEK